MFKALQGLFWRPDSQGSRVFKESLKDVEMLFQVWFSAALPISLKAFPKNGIADHFYEPFNGGGLMMSALSGFILFRISSAVTRYRTSTTSSGSSLAAGF